MNIEEVYPKYQDSEILPLSDLEVLENINEQIRKKSMNNNYNNCLLIINIAIILFVFFLFIQFFVKNSDDLIESPLFQNGSIDYKNEKYKVAILYSSLFGNGIARFMIVTGEYFIRKGYDVYFLTKPPYVKDFHFNAKIKRDFVYHNWTLIENEIKNEKIDFLIVNNVFDPGAIEKYKSFGVKVIGIFHGVYMSAMYNNSTMFYRNWQYTDLLDAFIHVSADDYYFFKHFGFKRNIFIPNLYTFEPSLTPSSNLTYNNIMMLGRLNDHKKGVIYAIKAMEIIIKEIPDAKLNLVSSDGRVQHLKDLTEQLNLTNNINFIPYTENISNYFLNSSIFFFTSLTEAFPMALNEAKAHALPCVTFDVSYSIPFQSGVIQVEMFNHEALAREAIKLLKDYDYRKKMGIEAKLSLNKFNNDNTTELWGRLFHSLKKGEKEFQKLRNEIENKYYNEEIAEKHMQKQLEYLKIYNKFFRCHSLKNFIDLNYINNIEICPNVSRRRRRRRRRIR